MSESLSSATLLPPSARAAWWAWLVIPALILLALAGLWYAGWRPAQQRAAALVETATQAVEAPIRARVGLPRPGPAVQQIVLPATIEPVEQAVIHARVAGVITSRAVELGAQVSAGQVLATIDDAELARQVALAEAQLGERRANAARATAARDLAQLALARAQQLGSELLSRQTLEERQAQQAAAAAELAAATARIAGGEAELARLRILAGFTQVTAPIAGTVVERSVELGASVAPGGGQPLLRIARLDRIKVVIAVPQAQTGGLAPGLAVSVQPRGGAEIPATITRLAGALAAGRTMRVECDLAADPRLPPGGYVQVAIAVPSPRPGLLIPADALLPGPKGPQVAVVTEASRVRLVAITIESDDGTDLTVRGGLTATDRVLLNPSGAIEEGRLVQPTADPAAKVATPAPVPNPTSTVGNGTGLRASQQP